MPSPLGDKIRALRKQKKLSLEQLAELTRIQQELHLGAGEQGRPEAVGRQDQQDRRRTRGHHRVPADRVDGTPGEEVIDEAFFRKYKSMPDDTKKRLRKILEAWDDDA